MKNVNPKKSSGYFYVKGHTDIKGVYFFRYGMSLKPYPNKYHSGGFSETGGTKSPQLVKKEMDSFVSKCQKYGIKPVVKWSETAKAQYKKLKKKYIPHYDFTLEEAKNKLKDWLTWRNLNSQLFQDSIYFLKKGMKKKEFDKFYKKCKREAYKEIIRVCEDHSDWSSAVQSAIETVRIQDWIWKKKKGRNKEIKKMVEKKKKDFNFHIERWKKNLMKAKKYRKEIGLPEKKMPKKLLDMKLEEISQIGFINDIDKLERALAKIGIGKRFFFLFVDYLTWHTTEDIKEERKKVLTQQFLEFKKRVLAK